MLSASLIVTLVFVPKDEASTLAQVNVPCAENFFLLVILIVIFYVSDSRQGFCSYLIF